MRAAGSDDARESRTGFCRFPTRVGGTARSLPRNEPECGRPSAMKPVALDPDLNKAGNDLTSRLRQFGATNASNELRRLLCCGGLRA